MADQDPKGKPAATAERPRGTPGPEDRTLIRSAEEGEEATPPRAQYQPPYMVIVEGPHTGARFPLGDGPNVIGRAPESMIRLEDQSVSRQHAEIMKGASGWIVKDLGSKNGTMVNGKLITDAVVIGHKDIVKTGIYQLRLITQPTRLDEEMTLPPEMVMADRTVFVAAPPDHLTAEVRKKDIPAGEELPDEVAEEAPHEPGEEAAPPPPERPRRRQVLMLGALALVLIVVAAYYANRILFGPAKLKPAKSVAARSEVPPAPPSAETPPVVPPPVPPEGAPPGALPAPPGAPPAVPVTPPAPVVQAMPVFLDFASSPMPAKVTFQDKELGTTPLRINVELEPGKAYQAQALFVMPEIQQQYTQQVEFTVEKDKPMVPILFRGPIGTIKVMDLPRDVQFYLEGKFSYDKFHEQSAKLKEIVLQKPIYIPFGTYKLDLRRAKQLGETSPTYVPDIIFLREFAIAEDSPTYVLEVKEEDLKTFPVRIKSDPPNADVFIDGQMVGKTPYEGNFPLGEHRLALRKEGYFEHSEDLKVDINTPFVADVKMKTSLAGAHINNARLAMNRAMWQDAINELAEALNSQPAPSEVALTNYLLGVNYLRMNDIQRAMGYFEQAKGHESQRLRAMLGLSNCYAIMQRMDQALPLLVEVLLKALDEETKMEAHDLFQKISPFRSVIYVYSDPPGAKVLVNDKPVAQPAPVILHELPLGNYRIRVEKPGYQPTDLNLSLSVNEFNPVIVKLRPIQE